MTHVAGHGPGPTTEEKTGMPDPRVQTAIDHWAPRFVQAGVDYNDFTRTTAAIDRWEDWLDGWDALGEQHAELAREAEAEGRNVTAGDAWLRAAVAWHFGKFVWVLDDARSAPVHRKSVDAFYAGQRLLGTGVERIEVPLDGASIVGNLRRPPGPAAPLVLLLPGLDSTKEEFFLLEEVFLRRGMATLSLDGPGQGESADALPIRPDYEVAVTAVLDALGGRDDVDHARVGAVGVSMGGYYAPRAAAFEPRVLAVVGISGPFNMGETWDDLPPMTRQTFMRKSHTSNDDEARARALELDLDGVLDRLEQPALFVTGDLDRIIPWESTRKQAEVAPKGRFELVQGGLHGVSNYPYLLRPMVGDWIREQIA
jgi:pimeloyl-ACP methyl ester carboxylesterase